MARVSENLLVQAVGDDRLVVMDTDSGNEVVIPLAVLGRVQAAMTYLGDALAAPVIEEGPVANVAEACADALLSAVGALLMAGEQEPTVDSSRSLAVAMVDRVLARVIAEHLLGEAADA